MVRIGHKGIRNQARLKSFDLKFILTTTPTVRLPLSATSVSMLYQRCMISMMQSIHFYMPFAQ